MKLEGQGGDLCTRCTWASLPALCILPGRTNCGPEKLKACRHSHPSPTFELLIPTLQISDSTYLTEACSQSGPKEQPVGVKATTLPSTPPQLLEGRTPAYPHTKAVSDQAQWKAMGSSFLMLTLQMGPASTPLASKMCTLENSRRPLVTKTARYLRRICKLVHMQGITEI